MSERSPTEASARAARADAARADLDVLVEQFEEHVLDADPEAVEPTALVAREALLEIARFLRDERGYGYLRSVTAVDFHGVEPRFQVVYHLTAIPAAALAGDAESDPADPTRLLRLKLPVPSDDAVVPSVVELYPTADWHERETWDMFGIEFAGHPDLRRILMPEQFDGHPLRKDYPLTYEEVAFTFNAADVYADKPRAEE